MQVAIIGTIYKIYIREWWFKVQERFIKVVEHQFEVVQCQLEVSEWRSCPYWLNLITGGPASGKRLKTTWEPESEPKQWWGSEIWMQA